MVLHSNSVVLTDIVTKSNILEMFSGKESRFPTNIEGQFISHSVQWKDQRRTMNLDKMYEVLSEECQA